MSSGYVVDRRTEVDLRGTSIAVKDLVPLLQELPDGYEMHISYSRGDPRDPREYDTVTLEFRKERIPL